MQWFKHDANANMDAKLQEVLLDYGLEGYGLYWYCIELITGKISKDNITFQLEHDSRIIARNTGSTVQKVEEMMRRFVELGLFETSNGVISCLKIAKRLDKSMTSNNKMRELIDQVKSNHPDEIKIHHDAVSTKPDAVMQEEKKEEDIKIDNTKEDKNKKKVSQKLDFCSWPNEPNNDLLKEWKQLRTKLKAPVSQTVINRMGKELTKAVQMGFTVDNCLEHIIYKGWRGFEADWLKTTDQRTNNTQYSDVTAHNIAVFKDVELK